MDPNWALREVQLAFEEGNSPIFSYFESSQRITGHGKAFRSMVSETFDGGS
jgi:hypothetical protein